MVILSSSVPAWIGHFLAFMGVCLKSGKLMNTTQTNQALPQTTHYQLYESLLCPNSGCFGCCTKPTPIIAVDEPSKGLRIQGRAVNKPSISNDFWSSSTCDLDNSTVQSQRSISSISVLNHNLGSRTGSMSSNHEFVNHGLLLWQQRRLRWVGSGTSGNQNQRRWESRLSWNSTEVLLGSRNPFPRPIPLSEVVDFLVDVWEQEGLYD